MADFFVVPDGVVFFFIIIAMCMVLGECGADGGYYSVRGSVVVTKIFSSYPFSFSYFTS